MKASGPGVDVLQPPAKYLRKFDGKLVIMIGSLKQSRALCQNYGLPKNTDSCSYKKGERCFIVVPDDGPVKDINRYKYHELAHCNGWNANHTN